MNRSKNSCRLHLILATSICALLLGAAAQGEEAPPQTPEAPSQNLEATPEKAQALLDQVKKGEQDRQVALKQTEIDRLQEDLTKTAHDSDELKKTVDSTTGLMNKTNDHLATLTKESRQLEHELAVSQAWINAEQLKNAGLQALADAQGKSLSALTLRSEEAAARTHLYEVELGILQAGQQVPADGHEAAQSELGKVRKALAVAKSKADSEERIAHEAMKAATAKMTLAESKAAMAQRLADNDLILEAAVAKPKPKAKAPDASTEKLAPVAAPPPKTAASTSTPSKPSAKTSPTAAKKGPLSLFR